ncbi:uncharacterized protein [Chanodichthys erythropterus]|uniref:uncharacterized protein n=1 Tax=Chanodichthys erythropterus TaxID=933992 RepID=UPI00351F5DE9
MSLTVSQDEGTTIITVTSNPKSKWPVLCQILGSLFCSDSPVCSVSEDSKETDTERAFGIVLIKVAVMNIMLGCFGFVFFYITSTWANSMLTFGRLHIVMVFPVLQLCVAVSFCVLTVESLCKKGGSAKLVEDKTAESRSDSSPLGHSCNMTLTASQDMKDILKDAHTTLGIPQIIVGVMNITAGYFGFVPSFWIGGVFLVVGIMCVLAVMFPSPRMLVILVILNIVSAALAVLAFVLFSAELALGWHHYSSDNDFAKCLQEGKTSTETCLYRGLNQIMLSLLQLFVTISFCVLTGKALCKKDEDAKVVEDPELHKPLLEDDSAAPDEH